MLGRGKIAQLSIIYKLYMPEEEGGNLSIELSVSLKRYVYCCPNDSGALTVYFWCLDD